MHETIHRNGGSTAIESPSPTGEQENNIKRPDPEVDPQKRRTHTIAYKLKVLETIARLRENGVSGSIGAYLRKEGLYSSTVTAWERGLQQGTLSTAHPGPKGKDRSDLQNEIKRLRRKLDQTEKKLAKTQLLVEIQKKLSALLEIETDQSMSENAEKCS
jgi:transposase-like protein